MKGACIDQKRLKVWLGNGGMVGCVSCRVLQEWCVTTLLALSVSLPACVSHPHKHTHNGKVETPLFVPTWHLDSGEGNGAR